MKKKALAIGIILLFIGTYIIPANAQDMDKSCQSASRGHWLYVGGDGPGNYTRIQDAINNTSAGDTIFVYHGWYNEHNLVISKINLIGEERNTTFINGAGLFSEGIHVGEGSTLRGFTIAGFTQYDITTGPGTGVFIEGNNITISDNIITACTQGIFFKKDCSQIEVNHNLFFANKYYGIYLQSLACSIHDNYFIWNQNFAIDVMGGTRSVSIDHNHFENNDIGIWVRSSRVTINRNNFIDNTEYNVYLRWETTLLTLPFVFYRIPSFSENYWDDWNGVKPEVIHGYFIYWIGLPEVSILVFSLPIVQFDKNPAQEPYDIPGMN
jgi:nitrous oxidase accessory protein NosD